MATLHARRVDEDLEERPRQRQQVDLLAGQLDRQIRLRLPCLVALVEVGAQRSADQQDERPKDAVAIQVLDAFQRGDDLVADVFPGSLAVPRRRRIEQRREQAHQKLGNRRVHRQRIGDVEVLKVLPLWHRNFA